MSRYSVEGRDGLTVDLGWDRPMNTFFAQVHRGDPSESTVLWIGTSHGECGSLEELESALRAYATLGSELKTRLQHDAGLPPQDLEQEPTAREQFRTSDSHPIEPIRFREYDCRLQRRTYENGRIALQLVDHEGPIATATINVPELHLEPDEALLKDYAENKGMLAALVAAGVVEDTGRRVTTGFVEVPVVRVLQPRSQDAAHRPQTGGDGSQRADDHPVGSPLSRAATATVKGPAELPEGAAEIDLEALERLQRVYWRLGRTDAARRIYDVVAAEADRRKHWAALAPEDRAAINVRGEGDRIYERTEFKWGSVPLPEDLREFALKNVSVMRGVAVDALRRTFPALRLLAPEELREYVTVRKEESPYHPTRKEHLVLEVNIWRPPEEVAQAFREEDRAARFLHNLAMEVRETRREFYELEEDEMSFARAELQRQDREYGPPIRDAESLASRSKAVVPTTSPPLGVTRGFEGIRAALGKVFSIERGRNRETR
jgi:hypothetical protein